MQLVFQGQLEHLDQQVSLVLWVDQDHLVPVEALELLGILAVQDRLVLLDPLVHRAVKDLQDLLVELVEQEPQGFLVSLDLLGHQDLLDPLALRDHLELSE